MFRRRPARRGKGSLAPTGQGRHHHNEEQQHLKSNLINQDDSCWRMKSQVQELTVTTFAFSHTTTPRSKKKPTTGRNQHPTIYNTVQWLLHSTRYWITIDVSFRTRKWQTWLFKMPYFRIWVSWIRIQSLQSPGQAVHRLKIFINPHLIIIFIYHRLELFQYS